MQLSLSAIGSWFTAPQLWKRGSFQWDDGVGSHGHSDDYELDDESESDGSDSDDESEEDSVDMMLRFVA